MRRKRIKKRQLPVSFFAFQDIITALAGALLIIVLVTAYGRSRPGAPEESMVSRSEYELLQQKLQLQSDLLSARQQELKQLRKEQKLSRKAVQKSQQENLYKNASGKVNKSLAEWELLYRKLSAEQEKLTREINRADPAMRDLLAQAEALESLQQELKHKQNSFLLESGGERKLVVLDCARGKWLWSDPQDKNIRLGADDLSPQMALNELRDRLKQFDPLKVKLLIAVRPSAGAFAQALKELLQREFPGMQIICEPLASETAGGFEL